MVARRSSIKSRSTSQYLSADKRSLSRESRLRASFGAVVVCPESFTAFWSLRRAFARRHFPRLGRAPPVTIVASFVLCMCIRIAIRGRSWQNPPLPPFFSIATELQKFRGPKMRRPALRAALSALGQPAQFHRVGLSGLHRRTDRLVRGTHAS